MAPNKPLVIASWNVNGLRACHKKGFEKWLGRSGADIVGVQEVRAHEEQLPPTLHSPKKWSTHFVAAERKGYSGVGLFSRLPADDISTSIGVRALDSEGRVQVARFGKLTVVNAYFPNGNGSDRDNSRVPFKLKFYRRLFRTLKDELTGGGRVLVMGDFNTAHEEIDLARPKQNQKTSGFLPEERSEFARWLRAGWVDTFRHFEPSGGHYTWWSQRKGVRERNVGWRIDYILASPALMPFVQASAIHGEVQGSDHCPISVQLDPAARDMSRRSNKSAKTKPRA